MFDALQNYSTLSQFTYMNEQAVLPSLFINKDGQTEFSAIQCYAFYIESSGFYHSMCISLTNKWKIYLFISTFITDIQYEINKKKTYFTCKMTNAVYTTFQTNIHIFYKT